MYDGCKSGLMCSTYLIRLMTKNHKPWIVVLNADGLTTKEST